MNFVEVDRRMFGQYNNRLKLTMITDFFSYSFENRVNGKSTVSIDLTTICFSVDARLFLGFLLYFFNDFKQETCQFYEYCVTLHFFHYSNVLAVLACNLRVLLNR